MKSTAGGVVSIALCCKAVGCGGGGGDELAGCELSDRSSCASASRVLGGVVLRPRLSVPCGCRANCGNGRASDEPPGRLKSGPPPESHLSGERERWGLPTSKALPSGVLVLYEARYEGILMLVIPASSCWGACMAIQYAGAIMCADIMRMERKAGQGYATRWASARWASGRGSA